jgi:hypothetical protein
MVSGDRFIGQEVLKARCSGSRAVTLVEETVRYQEEFTFHPVDSEETGCTSGI